tara:strand:+ start:6337 stop:7185 length:849 start_codon:yes stop_codon:yes gene_type:complete
MASEKQISTEYEKGSLAKYLRQISKDFVNMQSTFYFKLLISSLTWKFDHNYVEIYALYEDNPIKIFVQDPYETKKICGGSEVITVELNKFFKIGCRLPNKKHWKKCGGQKIKFLISHRQFPQKLRFWAEIPNASNRKKDAGSLDINEYISEKASSKVAKSNTTPVDNDEDKDNKLEPPKKRARTEDQYEQDNLGNLPLDKLKALRKDLNIKKASIDKIIGDKKDHMAKLKKIEANILQELETLKSKMKIVKENRDTLNEKVKSCKIEIDLLSKKIDKFNSEC